MQSDELQFQRLPAEGGELGLITLNRPKALNALNHEMIQSLYQTLCDWQADPTLLAVIVRAAEGRAFCAGGDIRYIYDAMKANDATISQFFWDEYRLNHCIYHFSKPYIALMDGITMGGGVGISIHGSHRVATERFSFAMPETTIGFFPDIGATHFLSRLEGALGPYLGLSGARLNSADSVFAGLVDLQVDSARLDDIIEAISQCDMSGDANEAITHALSDFAVHAGESTFAQQAKDIHHIFKHSTIESILEALQTQQDEWALRCLADLQSKSPISLKVTLDALKKGASQSFDACMQMEYRLVNHFLEAPDFMEGVRALIIDKDKNPNWQPSQLADISDDDIAHYFSALHQPELQFDKQHAEAKAW